MGSYTPGLQSECSTWNLNVFNASTGEPVLSLKVEGESIRVSTAGWKPGVYVVRATVGYEILDEKITVF